MDPRDQGFPDHPFDADAADEYDPNHERCHCCGELFPRDTGVLCDGGEPHCLDCAHDFVAVVA